jgi:hypothetical protein
MVLLNLSFKFQTYLPLFSKKKNNSMTGHALEIVPQVKLIGWISLYF